MNTAILSTDTPALFAEAVKRATALLRAGKSLPCPRKPSMAWRRTRWTLKRSRASTKSKADRRTIPSSSMSPAWKWQSAAWPTGPRRRTIGQSLLARTADVVLPKSKEIPEVVTAGGPTVGVRWPVIRSSRLSSASADSRWPPRARIRPAASRPRTPGTFSKILAIGSGSLWMADNRKSALNPPCWI